MSDYGAVIWGKRGQGKSKLLQRLYLSWPTTVVLYDPLHEHQPRGGRDFLFRPTKYLQESIVEACRLAHRIGCEKNPDPESEPQIACLLAADEIDSCITHPGPTGIPKALLEVAKYGRHRGVCFVYAARRPPDVPPALASQASDLFTFKQTSPVDLHYFKALGIPPDAFSDLEEHEFLHMPPTGALHSHLSPWETCEEGLIRW